MSMMELGTLGLQQSCFACPEQVVVTYAVSSRFIVLSARVEQLMLARILHWDVQYVSGMLLPCTSGGQCRSCKSEASRILQVVWNHALCFASLKGELLT